jgi:hypothetical protein
MMKKLNKHNLNFDKTISYFVENLKSATTLSNELLKSTNFEKGSFFTLLPCKSNFANLYEFETGGILHQTHEVHLNSAIGMSYTITPTIRKELSQEIFKEMNKKHLDCMFDDVNSSPKDCKNNLFAENGLFYEDLVYYLVKNKHGLADLITECLRKSNAVWHSLCILTNSDLQKTGNVEITLDDIRKACQNSQIIILGAYDSEGYVFWEKEKLHSFEA